MTVRVHRTPFQNGFVNRFAFRDGPVAGADSASSQKLCCSASERHPGGDLIKLPPTSRKHDNETDTAVRRGQGPPKAKQDLPPLAVAPCFVARKNGAISEKPVYRGGGAITSNLARRCSITYPATGLARPCRVSRKTKGTNTCLALEPRTRKKKCVSTYLALKPRRYLVPAPQRQQPVQLRHVRVVLHVEPRGVVAHLDEERAVKKLVEVCLGEKIQLGLPGGGVIR